MPKPFANLKLVINDSFFVALAVRTMAYLKGASPTMEDDLSVWRVHGFLISSSSFGSASGGQVDSIMKTINVCLFIVVMGANLIHNSLNSTTYLIILPEVSAFCRKYFKS